jgi:hypothetical protein
MAQLSEWLQIMLAEIARKREDAQRAAEEEERRRNASLPASTSTSAKAPRRI